MGPETGARYWLVFAIFIGITVVNVLVYLRVRARRREHQEHNDHREDS